MSATSAVDVAVIGGGPAGYAAALAASRAGASVALAEPEHLGGTCVNWSCIPTNVVLSAAHVSLEACELAFHGVIDASDTIDLRRLSTRRESLVRALAGGVGTALRNAGVTLHRGRAQVASGGMSVRVESSLIEVEARALVIAAGARWEVPTIDGISADRMLTADLVQGLHEVPSTALVLGGGPASTAFAVEYAFLLAALGSSVTLALPGATVLPGLDEELDPAMTAALETLGIDVLRDADVLGGEGTKATVAHAGGESVVGADAVVVADRRVPAIDGLGLADAGVDVVEGRIVVDESCRTAVTSILAAGDVTGGHMVSAAALHAGAVAGVVAAGGSERTRCHPMPHVLHTFPEAAWIGHTERSARDAGIDVDVAIVDLATNPRAITLGGRDGYIKLVADRHTGEVLGVHVVGPAAGEVVTAAAVVMQTEQTVHDLAAVVAWHPSVTESLVEAARELT